MIKRVKLSDIIIKEEDRLRTTDENTIVNLMNSIKDIGLLHLPTINQSNVLLSGFHRCEAVKRLNYDEIDVNVKETKSIDEDIRFEIEENLHRSELHYIEKAQQLYLLKEMYDKEHNLSSNGKGNNVVSFVDYITSQTDDMSKANTYKLISLGKIFKTKEDVRRIIKLDISYKDLLELVKYNYEEILDEVEFTYRDVRDVISFKKSKVLENSTVYKPPVIASVIDKSSTLNTTQTVTELEQFKLYNKIDIEFYYNDNKSYGYDIIRKNDMLQYHYFSQEYESLKNSSMICLITLKHKYHKEYIGFVSLQFIEENKQFRNMYYGKNFFNNIWSLYSDMKFLSLRRVVLLPSFRGQNISKIVIDKITKTLFNNELEEFHHVLYLELYSNMLHTFDFLPNSWNKSFINTKHTMSEDEYNELFKSIVNENNKDSIQGYKESTERVANCGFQFNSNYSHVLQEYLTKFYEVDVDDKELLYDDIELTDYIITQYKKRPLTLYHWDKKYETLS